MFFRRRRSTRPRRSIRPRRSNGPARPMRRGRVPRVNHTLAKQIRAIELRNAETKYVAADVVTIAGGTGQAQKGYVRDALDNTDQQTRMFGILPNVSQGTGGSNRVGDKITPIKLVVHVKYFVAQAYTNSFLAHIRQFFVTQKSFKNIDNLSSINAVLGTLLANGTGGTTSCQVGSTVENFRQLNYPLSTNFTKLGRGCVNLRIGKQTGSPQVQAITNSGEDTNVSTSYGPLPPGVGEEVNVTYTFKLPVLKYTNDNSTQPYNCAPLFGCAACLESDTVTYLSQSGTIAGQTGYPSNPIIRYVMRSEMWFKDI
nr:MAG: capsid protein [Cressdnaviricota sp.]